VERERLQGYVSGLEQIMRNTHLDLREGMDQFQELCHRITPERIVPMGIVTDIRQSYKEIQDQLTKIRGIHQLLQGKYSPYYRRDPLRDREIIEIAFLAKSLYSKFEFTLQEIEAKRRLRGRGGLFEADGQHIPLSWFQFKENQMVLLRNLRSLYELDYKTRSDLECVQRRVVVRNGHRSISLFILSGEVPLMDHFQSQMRLREHDIKERFTKDQLRGALTHLREISPSEVEKVIRRFTDNSDFSKLKCLLLTIQSQKDLQKEILRSAENILHGLIDGEVRTLSI
jgi:hypothetical protein